MSGITRCDGCGQERPGGTYPAGWLQIRHFPHDGDDEFTDWDCCTIACAQHVLELAAIINGTGDAG